MDDTIIQLENNVKNVEGSNWLFRITRATHVLMLNMSATQLFPSVMDQSVLFGKQRLDAQCNIVVSTPGPVFGDYRQQVLILESRD